MRLTKAQHKAHQDELRRQLAGAMLRNFVLATLPGYQMGWVHEEICAELDAFLQAVINKESPRLLLTMPPRHGKSELASVRFPAYALGRYPHLKFIATSYAVGLISRMSKDVQKVMTTPEYHNIFPHTVLAGTPWANPSSKAARTNELFEVCNNTGAYKAAGVGGGITGMGGDILVIDDPFKDRKEADSALIRDNVWDWYTSTLYTRAAPGGGILLIQTRWHEDDLAGRLLAHAAKGGEKWRCVNYPAIAETDEKHRKKGDPLHAARFPLSALKNIKRTVGTRDWSALYQQRPVPDGGAIFHKAWFKRYLPKDLPTKFQKILLSWDMTFKDTDGSDFVVGQVWGKDGANMYLLDLVRGRWDFVETLKQFKALKKKWPMANRILVEDKANGPAVISMCKKTVPGIIPVEPDGSKLARAHAVTAFFEAGNIYIPADGAYDWVQVYIDEMTQFPSAANDDMVDATTQAVRDMTCRTGIKIDPAILQRSALHRR